MIHAYFDDKPFVYQGKTLTNGKTKKAGQPHTFTKQKEPKWIVSRFAENKHVDTMALCNYILEHARRTKNHRCKPYESCGCWLDHTDWEKEKYPEIITCPHDEVNYNSDYYWCAKCKVGILEICERCHEWGCWGGWLSMDCCC